MVRWYIFTVKVNWRNSFLLLVNSIGFYLQIICEFALLLFASLHIALSSSNQWYNAIEFWSNVVCSMKDIKTVNFHGVLESSTISRKSAIFLERYFQAFIYDITRKCQTTILSRIYTPPDSKNLFVNNNDIPYRVVKRPSIWKIMSGDALPSRIMLLNNVTKRIRSNKTFDRTWNMHVILTRDVHFFDQISKDGTTFEWNSHDRFIVLFARFPEEHGLSSELNSKIDDVLKTLWFKHKVHKVFVSEAILINDTVRIDRTIRTYNPFTKVNNSVWGRVEIINVVTAEEASKMLLHLTYRRTKNMNEYVLKVGYFKPKEKSITEPIKNQSITRYSYAEIFKKFDEKMLNTIAQDMNFQIKYVYPTDNQWFGSQLFNGTYVGAIAYTGDIVYDRTDICFISFFVKKYSISPKEDVDFSTYVDFDRICMVVPKATKIPKGIRLYHFFPLSIWICLMLTHIFTYLIWYFLQVFSPKRMRKRSLRATIYRSFLLNVGCPQKLPNTNAERMLLSGVFLVNITLVGIFNGILYNSFAYDMYYPDIDSLHDLDVSGLPISFSSTSLVDLFDNDNNVESTLRNLRKKIQFNENGVISTAHYRNTSAIARERYFPVINEELADANGGPLLHLVKECPGKFYLSYLLPKNSIFNEKVNTLIDHLNQAGLPSLWYRYIVNAFDVRKKLLSKEMLVRNKKKTGSFVPFTLADMQSSFYMLLIGLLISTIVFFHEKGWLKVPLLHIEKPNYKSTRINH
ncbi:GRID2 protein, partial [Acromyrmex charruanus]